MCLWSRRTRDAARDEAMKNTRGRGGYARVERREARKKFGVECAGGMTRKRERERERGTDGVLPSTHTHMHLHAEEHRTAISKWNSNSAHLQKLQDNNH